MNNSYNRLVGGWKECGLQKPPFIFPSDLSTYRSNLNYFNLSNTFTDFISSSDFGLSSDSKLHVGLMPVPYMGHLQSASIFILMLNPGFNAGDYFGEEQREFKMALMQNLQQENANLDYPFIYLAPNFSWNGGGIYWQKKLRGFTNHLSLHLSLLYRESLKLIAQKVAVLQLIPYHSKNEPPAQLWKKLASVRAMQAYVKNVLVEKAVKGDVIIIATRKVKEWDLPEHINIVKFNSQESRGVHLSPTTKGGDLIIQKLIA